ncbi:EF-hand domain pair [Phytophthora infestans]|uniref:EF-hand domain pair n=1 Tax=Phytophthora infestans TaxID=4787 RepID=A0A833T8Q0_PHYIN|nr:EF-hand domain pair [Phytophthora infestans]
MFLETNGLASHLSLEIKCVFTSNPKVFHIRETINKRNSDKREDDSQKSVADPAFAFTQPFLAVDWALLASTSTRRLFFHSDVERLAHFRELVLHSDLELELDQDEGLQIHEDHLAAFKMCQFSAQYLDRCVETLSQRLEGYSEDSRTLGSTKSRLKRKNKALRAQRRRLQKEHDDLDLLITTYQRVLEKNGNAKAPSDQPDSPCVKPPIESPPLSPTDSITSKKPTFLKTWEERERERRMEKEISKAQRIEQEKQGIIQRVLERQQREEYDALFSKFAENRKQRAAKRIQAFFRDVKSVLHAQRCAEKERAAIILQAAWKRNMHAKEYPRRLEARKQENEILLVAKSEQETREYIAEMKRQREEAAARALSPPESIQSNEADDGPSPSASPSKQVVDALVATWRKLHRVFVVAHKSKGVAYHALFEEIDLRKDDVIDRAELRLGARSFGVRLDRKITRALITLIRTKCGVPSKPLLVTFEQFMTGFELTSQVTELPATTPADTELDHPIDKNIEESKASVDSPDTREDNSVNEEDLVTAVRAFRAAVYESATSFLAAQGKSPSDYKVFRETLSHVFSRFDADRNGQLDVDELVVCMSSFNLQLSSDKISLLRELFVGERDSDKVGVAEFVSFILAHSSSTDADELGLLGRRIRETIMNRVREAQAHTDSIEAAVRLVFRAAYKRQNEQSCSSRDFMRVLNRLRLDATAAQLARLVVRLDCNGDRSISFDELLMWLRIRSEPAPDDDLLAESGRATSLQLATAKAKAFRALLEKLAPSAASPTGETKTSSLTALSRQIDRDNSGKINQDELQEFLHSQDLLSIIGEEALILLCGLSTLPLNATAVVAQEMMRLVDLNGNGVTTLKEWLAFANDLDNDPAVIEAMRTALRESESSDPERLVRWFSELPGAIQAATTRQGEADQMKVRVAEFKTSLRAKLGGSSSVSMQTLDRVVGSLDNDSSGWITTSELCAWAFPPRDLEELLRLVIRCWQGEQQQSSGANFGVNLFRRFDVDNNGSLAVREVRRGFVTFGLALSEYETRVLLVAFDLDGDGCWDKSDFVAFVNKLFPVVPVVDSPAHTETPENPTTRNDIPPGCANSGDDLLLDSESSNGMSTAYSDEREESARPVDYSEDFVED